MKIKSKRKAQNVNGLKKKVTKGSKFSSMSVDDFMNSNLNDSDDTESTSHKDVEDNISELNNDKNGDIDGEDSMAEIDMEGEEEEENGSELEGQSDDDDDDGGGNSDDDEDDDSGGKESGNFSDNSEIGLDDGFKHKKSLEKLRQTDPEFYQFLEQNDKKLLQFNVSDSEDEDAEEDQEHKSVEKSEVASDESDFEDESKPDNDKIVTLKMVKDVQEQLQNACTLDSLRKAALMFHSALQTVVSPQEESADPSDYVVEGSGVFNAVIQMCVLDLQSAIKRFLKLPQSDKQHIQPTKCKKWNKVKVLLQMYFHDLFQILGSVTSTQILGILLKHLHQLAIFVPHFPQLRRPLLKRLIKLWGAGEETIRVLAFLCLLKITTHQQEQLLELVLKMMYSSYVRNSKFASPSTLPSIQFMRRSLAEMFALDDAKSYQYVFLYVRQLAIHLRNAITLKKKESIQAVYNWQFIHSLHLWVDVLIATVHRPHLKPLLYPLVQVIIGTIKLVPTSQYYPLRFHCIQMLIRLSKQTSTYIPVLPFILEVLNNFNFNRQHKKLSMKPLTFTCILRLSKSQLQENGFKDAIIEKIYEQLLEYLASESHTLSFPDVVVPTIMQLKKFNKMCKFSNYNRKMKQILDKIEENAKVVESERRKVSFSITDTKAVDAWETTLKVKGTPLAAFYDSWNKANIQQKKIIDDEPGEEITFPTLKKRDKNRNTQQDDDDSVELFPSDDSDDDKYGLTGEPPKKKVRSKKNSKTTEVPEIKTEEIKEEEIDDDYEKADIVKDLKLSDFK